MKITVFTPTYNRAYILSNLYHSLQRQTYFDFEWLIIDDGSTDNTQDLVRRWQQERNRFLIQYYKQENGGKCRAINRALDLAHGELFFTVDSDDYLVDEALEKIVRWEKELPETDFFCGVAGNLGTSATETPNTIFSRQYYEGTLLDRYKKVDGERAIAFYTKVHRKFKYPEFPGEKFMTEAIAWNRMAHAGYKIRFFNDIIWIFEYKPDGLTKAGFRLFLDNPHGYGLFLYEKSLFLKEGIFKRFKLYYSFTLDLKGKYADKEIAEYINTNVYMISFCRLLSDIKQCLRGKRI